MKTLLTLLSADAAAVAIADALASPSTAAFTSFTFGHPLQRDFNRFLQVPTGKRPPS